jgi:positive regulator of sigma E activity
MIVTALIAIVGIVFFFITEDMTKLMVFVDNWTIVSAIIFAAEIVCMIFALRRKKNDGEEDPAEDAVDTTGQEG